MFSAGDLDTSFGTGGKVVYNILGENDAGYNLAVQSDGKILQAGIGRAINNDGQVAIQRYGTSGSLDTTFDGDGTATLSLGTDYERALDIAVQSDGKIVVAGDGTNRNALVARYNSDGTLDTSFNSVGYRTDDLSGTVEDYYNAVALQSDGKIVVAGGTYTTTGGVDLLVARFNTDGSFDTTFDGDGVAVLDGGHSTLDGFISVAIAPDGKIIATGRTAASGYTAIPVVRYNTDGSLDTTFDGDGMRVVSIGTGNDIANAVTLQPNGKILVAGGASDTSGNQSYALARFNNDGSYDTSFGTGGVVQTSLPSGNGMAEAILVQSDGRILIAGTQFYVNRYNPNGALDATFGGGDGVVQVGFGTTGGAHATDLALSLSGRILVGGHTETYFPGGSGATGDFVVASLITDDGTPTAVAGGPYSVGEGGSVALSGAASSDPGGLTLTYEWDLDNNGSFETSGLSPTFSAASLDGPTSRTVGLRVTNTLGMTSATSNATVNITNVAPTASAGVDRIGTEDVSMTISGTFSDPAAADTHTFAWEVVNAANQVVATATTQDLVFVPPDGGTYTATFTVTDDDGGVSAGDSTEITVSHVAPIADGGANQDVVRGRPVAFSAAGSSSPGDTIVTYEWDFDYQGGVFTVDGTGVAPTTEFHDFLGTRTVAVRVTDEDSQSAIDTLTVDVAAARVMPDGNLVIGGTSSADDIDVEPSGGSVVVKFSGTIVGTFSPTGNVYAYSYGGNDTITMATGINRRAFFYGGAGSDMLTGGDAADELYGEADNDWMQGGIGGDVFVGGTGDRDEANFVDRPAGVTVTLDDVANDGVGGASEGDNVKPDVEILAGSAGNDTLNATGYAGGSTAGVILAGYDGNDTLYGSTGSDTLYGHSGDDWLEGGEGADEFIGESGFDTVDYRGKVVGIKVNLDDQAFDGVPGPGGDVNTGERDNVRMDIEQVVGTNYDDVLYAKSSTNTAGVVLWGEVGVDVIDGSDYNDIIIPGAGNDTVHGHDGHDNIDGNDGDDYLYGDAGNDVIRGHDGSDHIYGGDGNDVMEGLGGNDWMQGGIGGDTFVGGDGDRDEANFVDRPAGVTVTLGDGANDGTGGGTEADNVWGDIEILAGSTGNDTLNASGYSGGAAGVIIAGYDGNDGLTGTNGADELYGHGGTDTLFGGAGNDRLEGGSDADTLYGQAGDDRFYVAGDSAGDVVDGGTNTTANPGDQSDRDLGLDSLTGIETVL